MASMRHFREGVGNPLPLRLQLATALVMLVVAWLPTCVSGQQERQDTAYLHSFGGYGMRSFVRNRWGAFRLNAMNSTDKDREVFVTLFHDKNTQDQYCKRIWIPANSRLSTWVPFFASVGEPEIAQTDRVNAAQRPDSTSPGITLAPPSEQPLEVKAWVVDISDGLETPVPTSTGEMQMEATIPLAIRELRTGYMHSAPELESEEKNMVYESLVALRISTRNSRRISAILPGEIPVDPLVLGSYDNMLIATDDLFQQTGFIEALQGWLLKGGQLWLMLDQVSPDVAQQILGNAAVVEWVDDTSMNAVTLNSLRDPAHPQTELFFEDPVVQRRVIVEGGDVEMEIDGWPALFWVPFGRGKIMVTTLEARGWVRKFAQQDVEAGMAARQMVNMLQRDLYQNDFVLIDPMKPIADKFVEQATLPLPPPLVTRQYAAEQIGYAIPSRWLIGSVLTVFCVVLAGSGWWLIRTDRAAWMLAVSPLLALTCGGILYGVGASNRQQAPETLSQLQFVRVVNGSSTIDVDSTGTIYVNSSEKRTLASKTGDLVHLTRTEANNENRRMIWEDDHCWQLDNVVLPAGQSFMTQPGVEQLERPARAAAAYDDQGVVGQLDIPGLVQPADAVLVNERGFAAVELEDSGAFRVRSNESLAAGQFIASDVLDDEQRRRQEFYRELFLRQAGWEISTPVLYFWDRPRSVPLDIPGVNHFAGAAVYAVPLAFSTPEKNTPVTIPQSLLRMRTGSDPQGERTSPVYSWRSGEWVESKSNSTVYFRFQIPSSLLPIRLEEVKLTIQVRADQRKLEFGAVVNDQLEVLRTLESPRETVTFVLTDPSQLALNQNNEWVFAMNVDRLDDVQNVPPWKIENVTVDIRGTANSTTP